MIRTPLIALALVLAGGAAAAPGSSFLAGFDGRFQGSGTVQRDVDPTPRRVSCSVDGTRSGETELSISGTCRAAVIFTRQIGADIRYDPASNTFSGVYTGSNTGPAQLSGGRLNGGTLTMNVTYAKPIYGDRDATMVIASSGNGFSLTVTDQIEGRSAETSSIRFSRR